MYNFLKIKQEEVSSNIKSLPLGILNFNQESDFFIVVKLEDTPLSLDSKKSDSFYFNYIKLLGGKSVCVSSKVSVLVYIINSVLKFELNIYPDTTSNGLIFRTRKNIKEEVRKEIQLAIRMAIEIITTVYAGEIWLTEIQKEALVNDNYPDKETAISAVSEVISVIKEITTCLMNSGYRPAQMNQAQSIQTINPDKNKDKEMQKELKEDVWRGECQQQIPLHSKFAESNRDQNSKIR